MTKDMYRVLEEYMLSCMDDSAHDREHIYRVLYNALRIAKTEKDVNYDVLIAACLLHDIGRKEQFENPELCHAMVGGEQAYDIYLYTGITSVVSDESNLGFILTNMRTGKTMYSDT